MLTTDDTVRLRAVASRWNDGDRYGALGHAFFTLLELDQYRELWHYELGVNVPTQAYSFDGRYPQRWTPTAKEGKAARSASRDGFGLPRERGASLDEGSGSLKQIRYTRAVSVKCICSTQIASGTSLR